eukprot:snap_masked-scaffold_55-processed-gene-0.24-mRNA-1 protein AED:1.00 eAED:1.00 QI:0/0/0/0/1/1/2/0/106
MIKALCFSQKIVSSRRRTRAMSLPVKEVTKFGRDKDLQADSPEMKNIEVLNQLRQDVQILQGEKNLLLTEVSTLEKENNMIRDKYELAKILFARQLLIDEENATRE